MKRNLTAEHGVRCECGGDIIYLPAYGVFLAHFACSNRNKPVMGMGCRNAWTEAEMKELWGTEIEA